MFNTYCVVFFVFLVFVLGFMYGMLSVSLGFPLLIALSLFSNVYLYSSFTIIFEFYFLIFCHLLHAYQTLFLTCPLSITSFLYSTSQFLMPIQLKYSITKHPYPNPDFNRPPKPLVFSSMSGSSGLLGSNIRFTNCLSNGLS